MNEKLIPFYWDDTSKQTTLQRPSAGLAWPKRSEMFANSTDFTVDNLANLTSALSKSRFLSGSKRVCSSTYLHMRVTA